MCGIAALFAYRDHAANVSRAELEAISARMIPRGPDAHGEWISPDSRVALASRRLAIIDPRPEGTQPLFSPDGRFAIVFNGEIYNHRALRASLERRGTAFETRTDTEVVLQLFAREGEQMLGLLRGMYAFAIWDSFERRLFLARDPLGIKPMYVADSRGTLRVASQVKALLAGGGVSSNRDPAGIAGFFLTGSVPDPFTTYSSIRSLEAGHWMYVGAERTTEPRRCFSVRDVYRRAESQKAFAELVDPAVLLREFVEESVRHHLESDVPVGVFLSSGIDSTTIAMLAQKQAADAIHSFTIGFEDDDPSASNEAPLAARFAAHLGLRHSTRLVTQEEFRGDLPALLDQMDQPTIDGVNTWFASKAAHEQGIKVALSGLGGDELFGSYPSFRQVPRLVKLTRTPFAAPAVSLLAHGGISNPKLAAINSLPPGWGGAYLLMRGLFMPDDLPQLMGRDAAEEGLRRLNLVDQYEDVIDEAASPFANVSSLEMSFYMRNQLLRDSDWASMAHSVELRTPLVDAWLLRQVAPFLLSFGSGAKQLLGHDLPEWIRSRRKLGFSIPLASWADLPDDGTSTRRRSWARMVWDAFA